MWAAKTPNGPSIKMHVQNIHTMDELKMTGNCLKGSRGLLSFDKGFDETEWGRLTKEVFTHVRVPVYLLQLKCSYLLYRFLVYLKPHEKRNRSLTTSSRSQCWTIKSGSGISK